MRILLNKGKINKFIGPNCRLLTVFKNVYSNAMKQRVTQRTRHINTLYNSFNWSLCTIFGISLIYQFNHTKTIPLYIK